MPRGSYHKKIGLAREQQILDALNVKPMTVEQLAKHISMCGSSIAHYLDRLYVEPRRAYVSGHERRSNGMPALIWSAGALPDVEFVPLESPSRKITSAERIEQVIELLTAKPRTIRELASEMHVVPHAAGHYITMLRKAEERRIYIKAWRHPSETFPGTRATSWAPIYAVGNKADKAKPKRETSAQRHARLYKDPAFREVLSLRRKRDWMLKKARKQPVTWFAALPGAQFVPIKEAA